MVQNVVWGMNKLTQQACCGDDAEHKAWLWVKLASPPKESWRKKGVPWNCGIIVVIISIIVVVIVIIITIALCPNEVMWN